MNFPKQFSPSCQGILNCWELSLEKNDGIWHMNAGCGLLKICFQDTSHREPIPHTRKDLLPHTHSIASLRFS